MHGNVSNTGYFTSGRVEILIYLFLQLSSYRLSTTES
jgi:hypothetical protein